MLSVIVFIVILSVIVLIHEFGHFYTARKFGIKAEEFGFGFPPKVWAKKIGKTIFSINLFPIGGFVRLKGEDATEKGSLDRDSFSAKPPRQRFIVAIAGIVLNFVLAVVIFQTMLVFMGFKFPKPELPLAFNYKFVGTSSEVIYLPKTDGEEIENRDVWKLVSINGQSVESLDQVQRSIDESRGQAFKLTLESEKTGAKQEIESVLTSKVLISEVVADSPADKAGIKAEDQIITINGEFINDSKKLQDIVRNSKGAVLRIMVVRPDGVARDVEVKAEYKEDLKNYAIGVSMRQFYTVLDNGQVKEVLLVQFDNLDFKSPLQKVFAGAIFTENMLELQIKGIGHFISQAIKDRDLDPIRSSVAGPLGIAGFTAQAVDQGFLAVLYLAGLLSAIIGFMNLLPFPALDGGRLFFIVVEGVTRRKVNPNFEKWVHGIGFAILIMLIILITYNDILRFIESGSFANLPE